MSALEHQLRKRPGTSPLELANACTARPLEHVSASQIKSYLECPRRWWWQKVQGISSPETFSQGLGKAVHSQLERYGQGLGEPDDSAAGIIARAGLSLLPDPREFPPIIEAPLVWPVLTLAGVPVKGFMDWVTAPTTSFPLARVIDHKTCRNFRYVKTAAELAVDPQMVIYARWCFERWPGIEHVEVSHIYYRTEGTPEARIVTVKLSREHVAAQWARLETIVAEMVALAASAPALADLGAVRAEWDACMQYGGCPHRDRCAADSTGRVSLSDALIQLRPLARTTEETSNMGGPGKRLLSEALGDDDSARGEVVQATPPATGLTLYVDALPVEGSDARIARPLEELVAEAHAEICKRENVSDLRLVGFGKGPGMLAALFRAAAPKGVFYVRRGGLNDTALDVLLPMADHVVIGIR